LGHCVTVGVGTGTARRCTEGGVARREALLGGIADGRAEKGAEKARAGWRICKTNSRVSRMETGKVAGKGSCAAYCRAETKRNGTQSERVCRDGMGILPKQPPRQWNGNWKSCRQRKLCSLPSSRNETKRNVSEWAGTLGAVEDEVAGGRVQWEMGSRAGKK
jgi:hypothetical protein